ncbi:BgtA-21539 [Blumeria graminis f. sp. tritici]|uniref:BgtA-21539 n=2 Tax=Blumeria graminis f. sp. tritici TaxID=62690 RepID=A0A9X9QCR2_BLUGR|nr:hypothetical protein BGT96224_A21539 [Blumeria graminis f. sp. tritici 96224]VDB87659.1 BgtA-21539 [Blumeria graminis f. sp. tritici]
MLKASIWHRTENSASLSPAEVSSAVSGSTGFDLVELLEPTLPRSQIYEKASLELKRLSGQPICNRVAAKLLINNCKSLNEIDEQNYHSNRGQLQQDQVDAFAATLTMCDMERANFNIPTSCIMFTSNSLLGAADIHKELRFSSHEINECLQGLGKNSKHWATWLSYRDSALLFCRAARLNIERDESISVHQNLTLILKEFTSDLYLDLQSLRSKVARNVDSIESKFKTLDSNSLNWKLTLDNMLKEVLESINGFHLEVENITKESIRARIGVEKVFSAILQNNAQMVAKQRQEMEFATSENIQNLKALKKLFSDSDLHAMTLKTKLIEMQNLMVGFQTRQDIAERRAQEIFTHLGNISMLLHDYARDLEQTNLAARDTFNLLRFPFLIISLSRGPLELRLIWLILLVIAGSSTVLMTKKRFVNSSMAANLILIFFGFLVGNLTVSMMHWQWQWQDWINIFLPSSLAALSHIKSTNNSLVDLDSNISSTT